MTRSLLATLALSTLAVPAFADVEVFGYSKPSDVLPEGAATVEIWNTYSETGVAPERERGFQSRLELETGLGNDVQVSGYLNFEQARTETAPDSFETKGEFDGISLELKWKLADASADPVGFALYVEPTVGTDELEFEMKAIMDKRIGDHYWAANLTYEPRVLNGDNGKWGKPEGNVELDLGFGFWVTQHVMVGIEARDNNWLAEGKWQNSALSVGPTVHADIGKFWVTLAVMPQVAALRGATADGLALEGDGQNRFEVRLATGFNF